MYRLYIKGRAQSPFPFGLMAPLLCDGLLALIVILWRVTLAPCSARRSQENGRISNFLLSSKNLLRHRCECNGASHGEKKKLSLCYQQRRSLIYKHHKTLYWKFYTRHYLSIAVSSVSGKHGGFLEY